MKKRVLTLGLIVILGILAGVGIVLKQVRDSLLREIVEQQKASLAVQERIAASLGAGPQVAAVAQNQQDLERRLASLEAQWKGLREFLKQNGEAPQPPAEDFSKVYTIPVDHSQIRGNKNAAVTIVEFVDFQCPFCARFHDPVLEVLQAYPDQVNYVLKNFPLSFHPQAKPASKAAFAAGEQGKYWEMVDALLKDGRSLGEDKFKELAGSLGLNVDKFMDDFKSKDAQWEAYIQKDLDLGSQVAVGGTPTFYLNGKKTMARDLSSFKKEIDQILGGQN